MQQPKYLLIDALQVGDTDLVPAFIRLRDVLAENGVDVQTVTLRDLKLGHCVGCFGCWLKTPGQCIQQDSGREIAQAIVQCDTVIFFSPVIFGAYSPELKRLVDRCLSPLNLPYLQVVKGETHHKPRYDHYPRLVGVGVQREPHPSEARIFKMIVGRNALQFHAPSQAASVVAITDSAETMRREFSALLTRSDPLARPENLKSLLTDLTPSRTRVETSSSGQRALLLVGSPKAKPSTSAALGGYLMQQLARVGWHTETLRLPAQLHRLERQVELLAAVERADLIILAFPIYNDALPYLVSYAQQLIARHRSTSATAQPQRLVAIANNGFPEPHHCVPALAICHQFAEASRLCWAGGLTVGGGEALSRGQPLPEIKRVLPPVRHVMQALDLVAESLANGQNVPDEAASLIARNPIYPAPFWVYRWIFERVASRRWEREAADNGVASAMLQARPYISADTHRSSESEM